MNRLEGLRVYLSGPIDRCPNSGTQWREYITPFLQKMNLIVFDPTKKPINLFDKIENKDYRKQLKQSAKYNLLSKEMRKLSNIDLRMVDICDFLIVHLDMDIYSAGTIHEMVIANLQKKPILLHFEQGKQHIPDWWYGRLPHREFFSGLDQLILYLEYLNEDKIKPKSSRWHFFKKEILVKHERQKKE